MSDWERQMAAVEAFTTLFDNQENCDVTFQVGTETIMTHKAFLRARSRILYDMTKEWTATNEPLIIGDISFDVFKAVLRYIYSDDVHITNENVFQFLYAAKCFEMDHLEGHCTKHINVSLNNGNVCSYMNKAIEFNAKALKEECQKIFSKETNSVLASPEFVTLSQPALSAFLDVEQTNVLEIVLFSSVKMWMIEECKREGFAEDGPNMRKVIGEALYNIRFPTMTSQDFADEVTTIEGLLTDIEVAQTLRKITATKKAGIECPFLAKFRGVTTDVHLKTQSQYMYGGTNIHNSVQNGCFNVYNSFHYWFQKGYALNRKSLQIVLQCVADLRNSNMTALNVAGNIDATTKQTCWNIFYEYHALTNSDDMDAVMSKLHQMQESLADLP